MTLPTVQMERTSQAALDLESVLRDLARTYALTTAEQLYVLATVVKAVLRPILDTERKSEPDAPA